MLRKDLQKLKDYYGIEKNLIKLNEELGELIQINSKVIVALLNGEDIEKYREQVISEIADVGLTKDFLIDLFDISITEIMDMKDLKCIKALKKIGEK